MKLFLICWLLSSAACVSYESPIKSEELFPDIDEKEQDRRRAADGHYRWHLSAAFLDCPDRGHALLEMMVAEATPEVVIEQYVHDVDKCLDEWREHEEERKKKVLEDIAEDKEKLKLWCKKHPDPEYRRYCNN